MRPGAAFARDGQEWRGVIEAIDIETGLGKQMRMTSLAARHIENSSTRWQAEQVDEPCCFAAVPFGSEERAVFQEIVGVKRRLPPFFGLSQKNTGSRYAPNTVSIAARISYSVQ